MGLPPAVATPPPWSMHPRIHTRVRIHVILRVRHDVLVPCVCHHVRAIFIQEIILNVRQINESAGRLVCRYDDRDERTGATSRGEASIDRSIEWRRIPRRSNRWNVQLALPAEDTHGKREQAIIDVDVRNVLLLLLLLRFSQLLSEIKLGSRSFTPLRFTHIKFIHRIIDIYVIKHVQHIPRISYQPRVAC